MDIYFFIFYTFSPLYREYQKYRRKQFYNLHIEKWSAVFGTTLHNDDRTWNIA